MTPFGQSRAEYLAVGGGAAPVRERESSPSSPERPLPSPTLVEITGDWVPLAVRGGRLDGEARAQVAAGLGTSGTVEGPPQMQTVPRPPLASPLKKWEAEVQGIYEWAMLNWPDYADNFDLQGVFL